jgi:hypothetical protein
MRFKAGDQAILALPFLDVQTPIIGEVVTIEEVGPFADHTWVRMRDSICLVRKGADYTISLTDAPHIWSMAMDWQLRKLGEDQDPAALTRINEKEQEHAAV